MSLTEETKNLLYKYFDVAVNLYGAIQLYKLLEIYNKQNEPITKEQFVEFVDNINFENKFYDIIGASDIYDDVDEEVQTINKDLVAEYLYTVDIDDYITFKINQPPCDYYIPKKEQFLKYADENYFEKTLEFISLRAFLRNLGSLSKERADEIAEEIQLMTRMGIDVDVDDVDFLLSETQNMGVNIDDENIYTKLLELCKDLEFSTRKNIYRGHTHFEVFSMPRH